MKKSLLILAITLGICAVCSACTPAQVSLGAIQSAFPSSQYNKAVQVATCESDLNPNAVSPGGGNYGLFQINKVHESQLESMGYSWSQIFDPNVNAKLARAIYNQSGWKAWSCS